MTHENGKPYTEIDNEMIEALLLIKITKRKLKIMLEVCRLLNGFHKQGDKISLSKFKEDTGIEKGNISKPLRECIEENMLIKKGNFLYLQEDIMKWAGVINLITSNRLSKRLRKVINLITKGVIKMDPSKETLKATIKTKGVGLKKLSIKEVDKLEGKKWLKQVMWQREKFSERFIEEIFKIYTFTQCYDTYLAYQDAHLVRDKEAWFLAKLRRGPEEEE